MTDDGLTGTPPPRPPIGSSTGSPTGLSFNYASLGWKAFQDLCVTVATEMFGMTVETFLPTRDGGRDGAFQGRLPVDGVKKTSSCTIQCKFTSDSTSVLRVSDLSDELPKISRLAKKGLADTYVLMTNARVTGVVAEAVRAKVLARGSTVFLVYGPDRLDHFIRESRRLRALVPRLYGLGDLGEILDERAYSQAQAVLESMREDLDRFVLTDAYGRAVRSLSDHRFVLLLGEPAAGKSMIASALAIASVDMWDCRAVRADTAALFREHWNPEDPNQFVWVDDAFGTTQFRADFADEWNRVLPELKAALHAGTRIAMTSRSYIWRAAEAQLKVGLFPPLATHQVIVDVQALRLEERRQILYNHLKLGRQSRRFRRQVKPFLEEAASNPRFLPETARRLGDPALTVGLCVDATGMDQFFSDPSAFLQEVISGLDPDHRAAIALLFMAGGTRSSPLALTPDETALLPRLGASFGGIAAALSRLEGSLVTLVREWQGSAQHGSARQVWSFKHPTVGDAYGGMVARDPELLDIYLRGATIDRLIREVSMTPASVPGSVVVVPESHYGLLATRLTPYIADRRDREPLVRFLERRASDLFVDIFVDQHPEILTWLAQPYSYLDACPEIDLAGRLHQAGMLPEATRQQLVLCVTDLAVETPDQGVLALRVRELMTDDEHEAMLERVRDELFPLLDDIVDSWASGYRYGQEDVDGYFSPLRDAIQGFAAEFDADSSLQQLADAALERIEDETDDKRTPDPEDDDDWRWSRDVANAPTERSLFDDVDA